MEPRFYDYREITAKRAGRSTSCGKAHGGHQIDVGDRIGWTRKGRESFIQCAGCWRRWVAENEEADTLEGRY